MTVKRDYYDILGVAKSASHQEIEQAYRKLAIQHHPDRVPPEKKNEAREKFKEITEAYAVLSDSNKRSQYDQFGHAGIDGRYTQEDIFRGVDFSSIFENMGFGGGGLLTLKTYLKYLEVDAEADNPDHNGAMILNIHSR